MSGLAVANGFRFLGAGGKKMALEEAYSVLCTLRQELMPLCISMTAEYIAQEAVVLFDNQTLKHESFPPHPLATAVNMLRDRQNALRLHPGERAPDVDFSLSFQLYPTRKNMLGMYFTQQSCFINEIRKRFWYDEYGYWTGMKPHGVTVHAWEGRSVEWTDVLISPYRMLNGLGVHISLVDQVVQPSLEQIGEQLPTYEARVARAIKAILFAEYCDLQGNDFEMNRSNMVDQMKRFMSWRSHDGLVREASIEASVRARIEPVLTLQVLVAGVRDHVILGE